MINDISDKDNKDWENFLSSNEKLPNKDLKFNKKNTSNIKIFDLHGYSLDEANNKIKDLIKDSYKSYNFSYSPKKRNEKISKKRFSVIILNDKEFFIEDFTID